MKCSVFTLSKIVLLKVESLHKTQMGRVSQPNKQSKRHSQIYAHCERIRYLN